MERQKSEEGFAVVPPITTPVKPIEEAAKVTPVQVGDAGEA